MKPLRLPELQDLLRGPDFVRWWEEHERGLAALRDADARAAELDAQVSAAEGRAERVQASAIDALAAVGAIEDDAAGLAAEAEAVENGSLDAVAAFEGQRERTSDLWLRLGGAERATEERRERVAVARTLADAGARHDARVDLADEEGLLARAGTAELTLDAEYRRESARKGALWSEVEALWAKSLELALLVAERGAEARRRHREAERLFREAEDRKERARQLAGERDLARREVAAARSALAGVLEAARAPFGCAPGDRFLYFARAGTKGAFAVALADDADSYGAPVKALEAYAVGREHGVARVAPAREAP
jgi:hypothetical protein